MTPLESLQTLRDVEGVLGSFVIDDGGFLVEKDLPSVFYADLFKEVGPRLLRLRESVETTGDDPQLFVLRFSEHKLHVRCVDHGIICALSEPKVNMPALKLALTLVARRFGGEKTRAPSSLTSAPPAPVSDPRSTTMPSMTRVVAQALPPVLAPPGMSLPAEPASSGVPSSRPPTERRNTFYRGRRV